MILVLSFKGYEQCTDPVIDWLLYYGVKFIKMTINDLYNDKRVRFDLKNDKVYYDGIDLAEEVSAIYYRRFEAACPTKFRICALTDQVDYEITHEMEDLINYLFFILKDKVWLPDPENASIDKLKALSCAKGIGLKIPDSVIVNNKEDLKSYLQQKKAIMKPIHFSGFYIDGDDAYFGFTSPIGMEDLDEINDVFPPTLIQEKVNKKFEIRTFYLNGNLFPAAVLVDESLRDHSDIKTLFRTEHIHWIPYKFPPEMETKITNFMDRVGLNTGSLDIIKTMDNDYVFIEVNSVGQYLAPSKRCNFNLEQLIAELLIKHEKDRNAISRRRA